MPRVRIEYDLPAEQEDLEGAIMGKESARILGALRAYLVERQRDAERAIKEHREGDEYLGRARALGDALSHLDHLTRAGGAPHERRIEADD